MRRPVGPWTVGGRPTSGLVNCFPAQWPHLVTEGSEQRSQQSFPCHPSCRVFPSFLYVSLWLTLLSTYYAPGIVSIFFDPHNKPMKVSAPILQTRNRAQGPEGPAQGVAAVSVSARTPQCGVRAFALPQLPGGFPRPPPAAPAVWRRVSWGTERVCIGAGHCFPQVSVGLGPPPASEQSPRSSPPPGLGVEGRGRQLSGKKEKPPRGCSAGPGKGRRACWA